MKKPLYFLIHMTVGTFAFLVHAFWWSWTRTRAPAKYEHWSWRLMMWADGLWWGEEGRPDL